MAAFSLAEKLAVTGAFLALVAMAVGTETDPGVVVKGAEEIARARPAEGTPATATATVAAPATIGASAPATPSPAAPAPPPIVPMQVPVGPSSPIAPQIDLPSTPPEPTP